ncbi:unnamed protein product [Dovyalis caffra]|uniref:Uncharacterized protein n=1 Tax=Dovyalis caffra TaxID=77055 RepID=A0AAV1R258_9ROSI|nr:unnamed protein product [Dovyalis caffra]
MDTVKPMRIFKHMWARRSRPSERLKLGLKSSGTQPTASCNKLSFDALNTILPIDLLIEMENGKQGGIVCVVIVAATT